MASASVLATPKNCDPVSSRSTEGSAPFSFPGTYICVKRSDISTDEVRSLKVELDLESADILPDVHCQQHTPSDLSGLG